MPQALPRRKLYHITHVDNLSGIVAGGCLLSDRLILEQGGPTMAVGMSEIKRRRLEDLDVDCHPGMKVGDCVPFYFCPRSIMLYVLHRANHPELTYRGGQDSIVHLEADVDEIIAWAEANGKKWAFSRSNAGAFYVEFGSRREELERLDWEAIAATDFRRSEIKERKQAEFLLEERFPFELVERIGVRSADIQACVLTAVSGARRPAVVVRPEWYF